MASPPTPSDRRDRLVEVRDLADGVAVARMLRRIANEIVERHRGVADVALVGIRRGGLAIAEQLRDLIGDLEEQQPRLGAVDITLYRDDVFHGLPRPVIGPTELPFDLKGVSVVLVDDVLYTGRTVRAALDALMDYGRPKAVQLAVLIDRGHRELPIQADYVGLSAETAADESVKVVFGPGGAAQRVAVRRLQSAREGAQ